MALPPGARDQIAELFEGVGGLSFRGMMGGLAVYSDEQVFAIMTSDGRIHVKAAGALAQALEAEGSEQFAYSRKDGKVVRLGYWTLPEAALDDADAAADWGRRALAAAHARPEATSNRTGSSGD